MAMSDMDIDRLQSEIKRIEAPYNESQLSDEDTKDLEIYEMIIAPAQITIQAVSDQSVSSVFWDCH